MTILEALDDAKLFGPHFRGQHWNAWRAFLAALFGLQMPSDAAAEVYRRCTGRGTLPTAQAREGWVVVGRRGGKSRIAALVAVYLSCFRKYDTVLAPGEIGTVAVIAADRRQSRTILRYVNGLLDNVPLLTRMVAARTRETITLTNRMAIEVHTASFRAVRGYTLVAVLADEIAFWRTDEDAAEPDTEILNGLRPGMATIPGAMLLAISSPYARKGALWENHRRHFGKDGDPVLVWQADTRSMNPAVDERVITEAYEQDEAAAAAEYGAQFRRDIEGFISREVVQACVVPDRRELPPVSTTNYRGFVDPSGGSQDSMTLAIAHRDGDKVIVDALRERRPPFSPDDVAAEFAELLKSYGVQNVTGDRYGGEWPRERLKVHGIGYELARKPKSDFYRDLLPMLNSGRIELLDHARLIGQLASLERRTARGGRDSIDHPPGAHDDVANVVAGVAQLGCKVRRPVFAS